MAKTKRKPSNVALAKKFIADMLWQEFLADYYEAGKEAFSGESALNTKHPGDVVEAFCLWAPNNLSLTGTFNLWAKKQS